MNTYLKGIAENVIGAFSQGISKVKLAKVIYYVHKDLVKKGLTEIKDLAFIRMPLGPVPKGFMELAKEANINVTEQANELSYNTQLYKLRSLSTNVPANKVEAIVAIAERLRNVPTSTLVAHSHGEPSWKRHANGNEYFITAGDLKRGTPIPRSQKLEESKDRERLQGRLIDGMIDEIVDESTALEYPPES